MFFTRLLGRARLPTNINSLPDNILCMIFHAVVFSPARRSLGCRTPLTYEGCSSPFSLLHVNSKWRRVVTGMKEIWRSIFIDSPSLKHIARTSVWMHYAGNNPLRIHILTHSTASSEDLQYLVSVLDILATKLDYWHAVVFEFNGPLPPNLVNMMKDLQKRPDPQLTDFFLQLPPNPREVLPALTIWGSVNSTPSLRTFRWACTHTPGLQLTARLETLDISSPVALDDILARLAPCKNLHTLRVRKITAPAAEFNPTARAPLNLAHLRELVLQTDTDDTDLAMLLQRIRAPSLVVLGLKNITHTLFPVVARFCNPTARAGKPYAVTLTFARPPADQDILEWFLMPQLQGVVSLSMTGMHITEKILDALTVPAHATATPPCMRYLEHLHLGTVPTSVDSAAVLRMLGSRFWPPPPACATHEMDGVSVDTQRLLQLKTATILVSEAAHTPQLKRYQTMFEQSVASTPGWGDRKLQFQVE